jgi:hypothetical protein
MWKSIGSRRARTGYRAARICCEEEIKKHGRAGKTSVFGGVMAAVGLRDLLAKKRDEGGGSARQRSVATVYQSELPREGCVGYGKKFCFAGTDFVFGEAFANDRNAQSGRNEALDHADAG